MTCEMWLEEKNGSAASQDCKRELRAMVANLLEDVPDVAGDQAEGFYLDLEVETKAIEHYREECIRLRDAVDGRSISVE